MLSTPKYGWCDITIGDWSDRVSYLTNFHIDLLDGILNILKSGKPSIVYCDAEGWDYMLVLDHYVIHIIESKEKYKLYSIDMKIEDFAVACYNDILKDINEWAKWDTDEMTENEIKGNRAKITRRLRLIKAIFRTRGVYL